MVKWLLIPWMVAWCILFNGHYKRKLHKQWKKHVSKILSEHEMIQRIAKMTKEVEDEENS